MGRIQWASVIHACEEAIHFGFSLEDGQENASWFTYTTMMCVLSVLVGNSEDSSEFGWSSGDWVMVSGGGC